MPEEMLATPEAAEAAPVAPVLTDDTPLAGTKFTVGELRMAGVPEDIVMKLPAILDAVKPRRIGLIEANGDWYVYRSLGRHEFKAIVKEATDRISKKAEAAAKAGQQLNPAVLNAESQAWLEEKVSVIGSVYPRLSAGSINEGEAGVPKLLHDGVMARSNFEQTSEPISL